MKALYALASKYNNVHVMENNSVYLSEYNTFFIGNTLRTETKTEFVKDVNSINNTLDTHSTTDSKLVVLSHGLPYKTLLLPIDIETETFNNLQTHRINTYMNAWICGYTRGAAEYVSDNGTVYAYNARGHIAKSNDFTGVHGWKRDAYIDIPNIDHFGGSPDLIA
jgi:hypothetical protein